MTAKQARDLVAESILVTKIKDAAKVGQRSVTIGYEPNTRFLFVSWLTSNGYQVTIQESESKLVVAW